MKKRPFATEGHLHLPRELGPAGPGTPYGTSPLLPGESQSGGQPHSREEEAHGTPSGASHGSGVRLRTQSEERFAGARLLDDRHIDLDLRAGDEILYVRGRRPEHGDLVLAAGHRGGPDIWKAYPEAGELRLVAGPHQRTLPPDAGDSASLLGVIVAVKRPLRG